MRIAAVSYAATECAEVLSDSGRHLSQWLTAAVGDGDYGGQLDEVIFGLVAVYEDPEQNAAFVKQESILVSHQDWRTGVRVRSLSITVPIDPSTLASASMQTALSVIGPQVALRLSVRPKRLPKGFDFARFAAAVTGALKCYAPSAA